MTVVRSVVMIAQGERIPARGRQDILETRGRERLIWNMPNVLEHCAIVGHSRQFQLNGGSPARGNADEVLLLQDLRALEEVRAGGFRPHESAVTFEAKDTDGREGTDCHRRGGRRRESKD